MHRKKAIERYQSAEAKGEKCHFFTSRAKLGLIGTENLILLYWSSP